MPRISALPTGVATSSTPFPAVVAGVTDQVTLAPVYTALDGKAALVHTHAESDVTNLVADLATKATASVLTPTLTPLVQSTWAWFNQGSATVTETSNVVQLMTPTAAGTELRGRLRGSYPSTPFTLTTIIQPRFQFAAGSNGLGILGITVTDGTKHKIFVAASFNFNTANPPNALWVGKYNTVNAAVSATVYDSQQAAGNGLPVWLRLADNGTNQTFSFSFDGIFYFTVLTEARTTHLTPSDLGLVVTCQAGSQNAGGNILSWAIA